MEVAGGPGAARAAPKSRRQLKAAGSDGTRSATSERGGAERHGLGHPAPTALSKREVGGLKRLGVLHG